MRSNQTLTYVAVAVALTLVAVLGGIAVTRVADQADARRDTAVGTGGPPPTGPSPVDDVAIIGDSITEQAEPVLLAELQPDWVVKVRGRGGYRVEQMEPYSIEAASAEPEQVIINLGSNDVLQSWPLDRSVEAYRRMLDYFSDARCVHLVTVNQGFYSPTDQGLAFRALVLNNQIRELATATGADVIDWSAIVADYQAKGSPDGPITSDSVHPTELGQQMMTDAYRQALRTCL